MIIYAPFCFCVACYKYNIPEKCYQTYGFNCSRLKKTTDLFINTKNGQSVLLNISGLLKKNGERVKNEFVKNAKSLKF